jgi:excisionase family DNA binding protein
MPIEIDGAIYYRTHEVCAKTGISRATLYRWLKSGLVQKVYRDRRGWRIFTKHELKKIQDEARKIEVEHILTPRRNDER